MSWNKVADVKNVWFLSFYCDFFMIPNIWACQLCSYVWDKCIVVVCVDIFLSGFFFCCSLFAIRYSVFFVCVFRWPRRIQEVKELSRQLEKRPESRLLKVDLKKKRTRKAKARGTGSAHSGNFLRNAGKKRCSVFGIQFPSPLIIQFIFQEWDWIHGHKMIWRLLSLATRLNRLLPGRGSILEWGQSPSPSVQM